MAATLHPPYLLTLFGHATLAGPGGPVGGRVTQRRRLALLAYLALSPARAASRDRLLALFWPESDAGQARHSLADNVYVIRKALGDDVLLSQGDDLRLDATRIECDVIAFEDAVAGGEWQRAVQRYAGPLLQGFHLSDAPDFERWLETERVRLAGVYARVLERLAVEDAARGHVSGAVEWWRRLVVAEPYNARAALGYMRSLVLAGDRASAIRHAAVHAALLESELGAVPDRAVTQLAEQLRQDDSTVESVRSAAEEQPSDIEEQPSDIGEAAAAGVLPERPAVLDQVAHSAVRTRIRRRAAAIAAGALVLAASGLYVGYRAVASGAGAMHPPHAGTAVVLPFRLSGADTALVYLREGLVDLLATRLTGEGGPPATDPADVLNAWRAAGGTDRTDITRATAIRLARSLGARDLILGSVVGTPANLSMHAAVIDVATGRVRASTDVRGQESALFVMVDALVARLLGLAAGLEGQQLAALTTTSLPALRVYLEGRSAYRRGSYVDALAHFHHALQLDSGFTLAARAILGTGGWVSGSQTLQRFASDRLLASSSAQTNADSATGRGYRLATEELEQVSNFLARTPRRAASWYALGEVLFHHGAILRPESWEDDAIAAFRRSLELDSTLADPLHHLASLLARRGEVRELRNLATRRVAADSTTDLARYLRWLLAVTAPGSTLYPLVAIDSLANDATLMWIGYETQDFGFALPYGRRATAVRLARPGTRDELFERRMGGFATALNRGRPLEALRFAEQLRGVQPDSQTHARLIVLTALYAGGDTIAAAQAARQLTAASTDPDIAELNQCVLDQWHMRRAVPGAARVDTTFTQPQRGRWFRIERAVCAAVRDALTEKQINGTIGPAAARLDALLDSGPVRISAVGRGQAEYAHIALARLLDADGNPAGALRALQRYVRYLGWQPYLAAIKREEGRLAAALGQRELAMRAFQHYLALRDDPEPAFAPEVERVRSELDALQRRRGR